MTSQEVALLVLAVEDQLAEIRQSLWEGGNIEGGWGSPGFCENMILRLGYAEEEINKTKGTVARIKREIVEGKA